ncbi:MAG: cytochrome c [Planctomycetes bacterium]|nr:cytochrome c [Planctomycetota bacterium]
MPKWIIYILLTMTVLAMIPPAVIARARSSKNSKPRIHFIQDMDNQARIRAQHPSAILDSGQPLFADGRGMRRPVSGTVAQGELNVDAHLHEGVLWGGWATTYPPSLPVTEAFIRRGQERFTIYCQPCHGAVGYGDGIVNQRAMELVNNPLIANGTTWVNPKNIHEPEIRDQPVGQIYNTITNGVRTMAAYAAQIPVEDRWAIVAYVKALQRSQYARPSDISANRADLPLIDLIPPEETE